MTGAVLVVSNTNSLAVETTLADVRDVLDPVSALRHVVTSQIEQLRMEFASCRWSDVALLVLHGGDGSAQRALTELLAVLPVPEWPPLAFLPAGTTNMTAYDLNDSRRFRRCLGNLRSYLSRSALHESLSERCLVKVSHTSGAARVGFFFGVGAIVEGIQYFQSVRERRNAGRAGPAVALARGVWGMVRGEPLFARATRVCLQRPAPSRTGCPEPAEQLAVRLGLATTLHRLLLGLHPFWGVGSGQLHSTWVEADAHRLGKNLPRLLSGRPNLEMVPSRGYHSWALASLQIQFGGAYTIDGEIYPSDGEPMAIEQTAAARVLAL